MQDAVGLITIVMTFSIPIIWVLGHFTCAAFKTWQEIGLKRDMVARGYTAQEIIAVVAACRDSHAKADFLPNVPPAKPIKQPVFSNATP
jgi:hypothetical protein